MLAFSEYMVYCSTMHSRHWFYEDFVREQNPKFPSLPLKKFSAMLFHACPLLHHWSHDHEQAFNTFMQYKTRVPVCGAIMLNDTWDKVSCCHSLPHVISLNKQPFHNFFSVCWSRGGNHHLVGGSQKGKSTRSRPQLIVLCERFAQIAFIVFFLLI